MLERRFLPLVPRAPTAVSDWLPSVLSSEHMSPLMLVLLVRFFPEMPICLLCILDVKTYVAVLGVRSTAEKDRERPCFHGAFIQIVVGNDNKQVNKGQFQMVICDLKKIR